MIIYKDILQKLKDAGYTTYRLRKENLISQSILTKIRKNQPITTETINTICTLTGLSVEELIEYKKDEEGSVHNE